MKKAHWFLIFFAFCLTVSAQSDKIKIAKLQYGGGGDWYANKTALPNLAQFCNENLGTNIDDQDAVAQVGSRSFSIIHMYI